MPNHVCGRRQHYRLLIAPRVGRKLESRRGESLCRRNAQYYRMNVRCYCDGMTVRYCLGASLLRTVSPHAVVEPLELGKAATVAARHAERLDREAQSMSYGRPRRLGRAVCEYFQPAYQRSLSARCWVITAQDKTEVRIKSLAIRRKCSGRILWNTRDRGERQIP